MKLYRSLLSFALCCIVGISTMATTGCTPQQKLAVVQDITRFLPAITNVAEAVCAFTPAAPVCVGAIPAVEGSANILVAAVESYFAAQANGGVTPGIVGALSNAVAQFEADAGAILGAIHVVDPAHQAAVEAVAAAASVLLAVVESALPSTSGPALTQRTAKTLPANFNLNAWAGDYNHKVAALEKTLPRSSKRLTRVRVHNVAARFATAGYLN